MRVVAKVIILQTISYPPLCFSFCISTSSLTTSRHDAATVTRLQSILDFEPNDSISLDGQLTNILDRIDVYEKKAAVSTMQGGIISPRLLGAKPSKELKVAPVAIKTLPSKEMTGLDPFYAQLCATVSASGRSRME